MINKLTDSDIYFIILQLLMGSALTIFVVSLSEIFTYSAERLSYMPTDVKLYIIGGFIGGSLFLLAIIVNILRILFHKSTKLIHN